MKTTRYGSWTTTNKIEIRKNPIGNGSRKFILCNCECGTTRYVDNRTLENGRSTNCGCARKPKANLAGQVFGLLTAISKDDDYHWLCRCRCGTEKVFGYTSLNTGKSRSCGCVPDEKVRKLKFGEASMNLLIKSYMKRAVKKGFECSLSKDNFYSLFTANCFYCNRKPFSVMRSSQHFGEFRYNGIDRVDSNMGYTIGNSRTCCKTCNFAKSSMGEKEFYNWIKTVHDNLSHKGLL